MNRWLSATASILLFLGVYLTAKLSVQPDPAWWTLFGPCALGLSVGIGSRISPEGR